MVVKIAQSCLTFCGLSMDEENALLKCAEGLHVARSAKGLEVRGGGARLYALLFELSRDYDVELV